VRPCSRCSRLKRPPPETSGVIFCFRLFRTDKSTPTSRTVSSACQPASSNLRNELAVQHETEVLFLRSNGGKRDSKSRTVHRSFHGKNVLVVLRFVFQRVPHDVRVRTYSNCLSRPKLILLTPSIDRQWPVSFPPSRKRGKRGHESGRRSESASARRLRKAS
jgi:hypothetical protein